MYSRSLHRKNVPTIFLLALPVLPSTLSTSAREMCLCGNCAVTGQREGAVQVGLEWLAAGGRYLSSR